MKTDIPYYAWFFMVIMVIISIRGGYLAFDNPELTQTQVFLKIFYIDN